MSEVKNIEIPSLQRRLSNGEWITLPEDEKENFFESALKKQQWIADKLGDNTPNTEEKLINALKKKREIQYGDDWYAQIRINPTENERATEKKILDEQYEKTMQYQKEEKKRFYEQVEKYDTM